MNDEVQSKANRLAVLIDADNAKASLIEPLLKEISKYGTAHVKRIYGDWTKPNLNSWKDKLNKFAILPIQQFSYTSGKNATDSALIIDAMDLLYTQNFDGFCIVSSDSDFTRLACRIREAGLGVYGFGESKTPEPFVKACDKFIYTEILETREISENKSSLKDIIPELSKVPIVDEPNSPEILAINTNKLLIKQNRELLNLLIDAYEAIAGEDVWANLGPLGAQLTKLSPSFDSRNYGYKKLGDLIRAIGLFEIRETPHENNPLVKELHIKLKSTS